MNKIQNFLLVLVLLSSCTSKQQTEISIKSPDDKIELSFELKAGTPVYWVKLNGSPVIDTSSLGFEFKNQDALKDNFEILEVEKNSVDKSWEQVWGEQKIVRDHHNEVVVRLKEISESGRKMNIRFKAFNDGVAFSYEIPAQEGVDSLLITNELSAFNLAKNYSTWFIPANFDSYEMLYQNKPANEVDWVNTPVTFEIPEKDIFLSIHEANLTNYPGMTLKKQEGSKLNFVSELVPWPDGIKVKATAPLQTPWRTIQISESAAALMESTMILNLNEPNKLEDVSWIEPAKYVGIWWGMHLGTHTWSLGERHGATTEAMIKYIDFAANNNIDAVLAEGWSTGWEYWGQPRAFDFITPYEDYDPEAIAAYAKEKGIKIIGHHETGGDAQYYEEQMDAAFRLYESLGMHDVKTGYAGAIRPTGHHHHGQWMVNHYRKVIETAAKYRLTINAHEPIKPTGIRRTYPNMMAREGARGMEWNAWSDGNPPEHHVIMPFTRILAGPLDYTPGIFDLLYENAGKRVKWNNQDKGTSRINTTLSKQLALYVVFYSPLQMAADLIDNYEDQPAFQFIRDVPVDWEFTKVLNAQIGDFVTVVRKDINSGDWYLGAVTDENGRNLEVKLDFLEADKTYIAEIYADAADSDWKTNPYAHAISTKEVSATETLNINLAPGGGQAIRFKLKK